MAVIETEVDVQAEQFVRNAQVMTLAVEEFRAIESRVIEAAQSKAPRYIKRGLLPPRQRLGLLLDAGAPFLELSTLCGYMQEEDTDGSAAGGSCIAGIGCVSGVNCMILVDDYLTKGGSITPLGSAKRQRMLHLALENKLPVICLAQSGGGNLKLLGDFFGPSGSGFARQARLSEQNIASEKLLADLEQVDFAEWASRFQLLQTSLQASLQTTSQILNLSLIDFLR